MNKCLIILESSYFLKNNLTKINIKQKDIFNIEFLATNGSIFKYSSSYLEYKIKNNQESLADKIKYFSGDVFIATDKDENGKLIALEIASLRDKKSYMLNFTLEDLLFKKEELSIDFLYKHSKQTLEVSSLIEELSERVKNETETKEFYMKTGLKLSINDRIMTKVLKKNLKIIEKTREWFQNINSKNKQDLYIFLAKTIETDFDINTIYEKLLLEYEKGNMSYIRTDGINHQPLSLYNEFEIDKDIKEIFNKNLNNIDNFFIIAKYLNIGTPSSIYFIYKNVMNNLEIDFEDDIDIKQFIKKQNPKHFLNIDLDKNSILNLQNILQNKNKTSNLNFLNDLNFK